MIITSTTGAPTGSGSHLASKLSHHHHHHHNTMRRPYHQKGQPDCVTRRFRRIDGRIVMDNSNPIVKISNIISIKLCFVLLSSAALLLVGHALDDQANNLPDDISRQWEGQQVPQPDNSRADQLDFDAINRNSDASFSDELEDPMGSSVSQLNSNLTSPHESSDLMRLPSNSMVNATIGAPDSEAGGANGTRPQSAVDVAGWASKSLLQKIIIVADAVIFVVGFIGNTVVILVILKFTKTETVTDIYIGNLAMADLMFITGLPVLTTTMIVEDWIFGFIPCRLYMAATSLNQFASSLLLVVMSFDRYLAVCHPIYAQRFRQTRGAKTICLSIWIICLLLMSPIVARSENDIYTCAISWPEYTGFNCEIAFTVYSFIIGFAGPILLIAGFYWRVIRKLRNAASGPIGSGSSKRSKRETANRRIEHLVIGIIMTYTLCWLPYQIFQLILSFSVQLPFIFYELFWIATSLSYTNSALNPMLYAFLSDNFRSRCSEVFQSIYKLSWCSKPGCNLSHSTATTACGESEMSRPESRHENARFLANDSFKRNSPNDDHKLFELNHKNSTQLRLEQQQRQATTPLDASNNNNSNTNNNRSPASPSSPDDATGSVYCGDRKKSVAFVVQGGSNGNESGNSTHQSQSSDRCQNV